MSRITYRKIMESPDFFMVMPYEIEVVDEHGVEYTGELDSLEVNDPEGDEKSYIDIRYRAKGSRRRVVIREDGSVSHIRLGSDSMWLHDVSSVRVTSKRNDEIQT